MISRRGEELEEPLEESRKSVTNKITWKSTNNLYKINI